MSASPAEKAAHRAFDLLNSGRTDAADRVLTPELESHPNHPTLLAASSLLHLQRHQYSIAGAQAAKSIELLGDGSKDPTASNAALYVLQQSAQWPTLAKAYERMLPALKVHAEAPAVESASMNLALTHARMKNFSPMQKVCTQLQRESAERAKFLIANPSSATDVEAALAAPKAPAPKGKKSKGGADSSNNAAMKTPSQIELEERQQKTSMFALWAAMANALQVPGFVKEFERAVVTPPAPTYADVSVPEFATLVSGTDALATSLAQKAETKKESTDDAAAASDDKKNSAAVGFPEFDRMEKMVLTLAQKTLETAVLGGPAPIRTTETAKLNAMLLEALGRTNDAIAFVSKSNKCVETAAGKAQLLIRLFRSSGKIAEAAVLARELWMMEPEDWAMLTAWIDAVRVLSGQKNAAPSNQSESAPADDDDETPDKTADKAVSATTIKLSIPIVTVKAAPAPAPAPKKAQDDKKKKGGKDKGKDSKGGANPKPAATPPPIKTVAWKETELEVDLTLTAVLAKIDAKIAAEIAAKAPESDTETAATPESMMKSPIAASRGAMLARLEVLYAIARETDAEIATSDLRRYAVQFSAKPPCFFDLVKYLPRRRAGLSSASQRFTAWCDGLHHSDLTSRLLANKKVDERLVKTSGAGGGKKGGASAGGKKDAPAAATAGATADVPEMGLGEKVNQDALWCALFAHQEQFFALNANTKSTPSAQTATETDGKKKQTIFVEDSNELALVGDELALALVNRCLSHAVLLTSADHANHDTIDSDFAFADLNLSTACSICARKVSESKITMCQPSTTRRMTTADWAMIGFAVAHKGLALRTYQDQPTMNIYALLFSSLLGESDSLSLANMDYKSVQYDSMRFMSMEQSLGELDFKTVQDTFWLAQRWYGSHAREAGGLIAKCFEQKTFSHLASAYEFTEAITTSIGAVETAAEAMIADTIQCDTTHALKELLVSEKQTIAHALAAAPSAATSLSSALTTSCEKGVESFGGFLTCAGYSHKNTNNEDWASVASVLQEMPRSKAATATLAALCPQMATEVLGQSSFIADHPSGAAAVVGAAASESTQSMADLINETTDTGSTDHSESSFAARVCLSRFLATVTLRVADAAAVLAWKEQVEKKHLAGKKRPVGADADPQAAAAFVAALEAAMDTFPELLSTPATPADEVVVDASAAPASALGVESEIFKQYSKYLNRSSAASVPMTAVIVNTLVAIDGLCRGVISSKMSAVALPVSDSSDFMDTIGVNATEVASWIGAINNDVAGIDGFAEAEIAGTRTHVKKNLVCTLLLAVATMRLFGNPKVGLHAISAAGLKEKLDVEAKAASARAHDAPLVLNKVHQKVGVVGVGSSSTSTSSKFEGVASAQAVSASMELLSESTIGDRHAVLFAAMKSVVEGPTAPGGPLHGADRMLSVGQAVVSAAGHLVQCRKKCSAQWGEVLTGMALELSLIQN